MATHGGELTVGQLRHFLSAFDEDTRVVLGRVGGGVELRCHANTYYPPQLEKEWPYVILDVGDN